MNTQLIFWILALVAFIQILGINATRVSIKAILRSDVFKNKVNALSEKTKNGTKTLTLLALVGLPFLGYSQTTDIVHPPMFGFEITKDVLLILFAGNVMLLILQMYLSRLLKSLLVIDKTEEERIVEQELKKQNKIDVLKILTDAVPLEQEALVETDHEYDGIHELDNNLPPWWKWGFYASIVFAVVYLLNFHFFKVGDLQVEAYEKDVHEAELAIQAYLEAQALNVDENSVIVLIEAKDLKRGRGLYMRYCKVCHGEEGQGLVGPNLTDDYWLYGGAIGDVFSTIKYGAKNGMKSWKDELNPVQMQQVASFIKSLRCTNPENPKDPQGELYEEVVATTVDTLAVN